jgi:O-succinylbenzoic acid--CoA ligase
MTETLSHIALRRINGPEATEWYTPFDGVGVSLNEEGCLVIDAPAVCETTLTTNDRAEMNNGRFRILGRRDNVVCSGGIKIQIEEVERRLSPYIKGGFMITKRRDPLLGEALVLLTDSGSPEALHDICRQYLPRYWQPRYILHVDALPLTPNGKPARQEAELLANSGQAIP